MVPMLNVSLGSLIFAWCTLMAVAPIRRPRRFAVISWVSSAVPNELPYLFLCIVGASTIPAIVDGELDSPDLWISLATALGLLLVARRAFRARRSLAEALDEGLGTDWRAETDPGILGRLRRHLPWPRILLLPWMFGRRDVERVADLRYGEHGRSNLLDVHRHRSRPGEGPTLIYLHGGRFKWGRKGRTARPLIYHLASQGWTCVTANYRLAATPSQGFPAHLIDAKKVIAWVRTHGREHGADPDRIFLAGSSSGAHMAAMAALTANDPTFQPGFEAVDTSIAAGIGLYGYYGPLGGTEQPPSTPLAYLRPDAPPLFVIHGENDTYTPVSGARALVENLRETSDGPVVYAELPGAQHSFDLFHSVRLETVIDAIEAFAGSVRSQGRPVRMPESPC
jgi:acetyl esterase/lipase